MLAMSIEMKTVTQTSAGGVIFDGRGRVVLTARRSFKGELNWGLPKGLVEKGERHDQTALREAREETGFEVELVKPLSTIDYWYVQPAGEGSPAVRVHKFVHYFLMQTTGGDPAGHDEETEEVALLHPEKAIERITFPSEAEVIRAAFE